MDPDFVCEVTFTKSITYILVNKINFGSTKVLIIKNCFYNIN